MILFILLITSKVINKEISKMRIFLSSNLGGILIILSIIYDNVILSNNFIILLVIITICVVLAFTPKSKMDTFKIVALVHIISFAVGGLVLGVYFLDMGNFISKSTLILLVTSTICTYVSIKYFLVYSVEYLINKQISYKTKIMHKGKSKIVTCFLDSGNNLVDEISKRNVIIVEYKAIKTLLDDEIIKIFEQNSNLYDIYMMENEEELLNYRVIEFSSLGNNNGKILCFKTDKVEILIKGNYKVVENVMIGISNLCFSETESYEGILNRNVI